MHIKHVRFQMDGASMRSPLLILSATENVLGNSAHGLYRTWLFSIHSSLCWQVNLKTQRIHLLVLAGVREGKL